LGKGFVFSSLRITTSSYLITLFRHLLRWNGSRLPPGLTRRSSKHSMPLSTSPGIILPLAAGARR
jgi:hypothetical protein